MGVFSWLENTQIATAIRESTWLFPTIETVHVFAIVLVVGTVMIVDLRLLHVSSRDRSVPPTQARVAGGLSLLLWFGVISLGRWIGFTT